MPTMTWTDENQFTVLSNGTNIDGTIYPSIGFGDSNLDSFQSNLISYYKLSDTTDEIGTQNLTNSGASFTSGKINNGALFDGTGFLYAPYNSSQNPTSGLSIALWAKADDWTVVRQQLFGNAQSGGGYYITLQDNLIKFASFNNNGVNPSLSYDPSSFNPSSWHHITYTFDGQYTKIFIDGTAQGTHDATSSTTLKYVATQPIGIGVDDDLTNYKFSGMIDEIGLWNSALSQDAITALYNSGTGRTRQYLDCTFLIHDAGTNYLQDSGDMNTWDNSTASDSSLGTPSIYYRYSDYSTDQEWSSGTDVDGSASWSDWMSISSLQSETDSGLRYRYLESKISAQDGTSLYQSFSCDYYAYDISAPQIPTILGAYYTGTDSYNIPYEVSHGTDEGGSGYAGANFAYQLDGTWYYEQISGTYNTSEVYGDILLQGTENTTERGWKLSIPITSTHARFTAWDLAGNNSARADSSLTKIITDIPDIGNVTSDDTLDGTTGEYQGIETTNGTDSVESGKQWGDGGTEYTGSLIAAGTFYPPEEPTVTFSDNGDNTGATVYIDSGSGTATHSIYTISYSDSSESLSGTVSGNGTASISISSDWYWGWVVAEDDVGMTTITEPQKFRVTTGDDAWIDQILDAVAATIYNAGLEDANGTTVSAEVEWPPIFRNVNTPVVKVFPGAPDLSPSGFGSKIYTVRVNTFVAQKVGSSADYTAHMKITQDIQDLFVGKRLDGLTDAYCSGMTSPAEVDLERLRDSEQWVSPMTFEFQVNR